VAAAAAALALVQVGLGIAAVLSGLAVPLRATHAVVAYLLWATLVWISVRTGRWSAVVTDEARAASRPLAGIARAS
jgi:heme A synthase